MNLDMLRQEARKLLDEFGLTTWTFKLGSYKRNMGRCYTLLKIISVSEFHAIHDTTEQVLETVRHEIAHALAPDAKNHGPVWQARAIQVGCKDVKAKCSDQTVTKLPAAYYAICGHCWTRHEWLHRPRKGKRWFCAKCPRDKGELFPVPDRTPPPKRKGLFD